MLGKKAIHLFQRSVAIVRKILIITFLFIVTIFLSSCGLITDTRVSILEKEIAEYKSEVNKLKEELDNIYDLFTDISLNVVQANVMITTNASKTISGIFGPVIGSQGSGVIFHEANGYYYILTNNHVIYVPSGYLRKQYEVYDYKMEKYVGELLFNSADYDLAVLRFKKVKNLKVLNFAKNQATVNDMVIAIGQPEGQVNAITFGKVLGFSIPNCNTCDVNRSNVKFECIYHDANINKGNSGGMLINSNKEIVGINTFGSEDGSAALAVGIDKIKEFLEKNDFSYK